MKPYYSKLELETMAMYKLKSIAKKLKVKNYSSYKDSEKIVLINEILKLQKKPNNILLFLKLILPIAALITIGIFSRKYISFPNNKSTFDKTTNSFNTLIFPLQNQNFTNSSTIDTLIKYLNIEIESNVTLFQSKQKVSVYSKDTKYPIYGESNEYQVAKEIGVKENADIIIWGKFQGPQLLSLKYTTTDSMLWKSENKSTTISTYRLTIPKNGGIVKSRNKFDRFLFEAFSNKMLRYNLFSKEINTNAVLRTACCPNYGICGKEYYNYDTYLYAHYLDPNCDKKTFDFSTSISESNDGKFVILKQSKTKVGFKDIEVKIDSTLQTAVFNYSSYNNSIDSIRYSDKTQKIYIGQNDTVNIKGLEKFNLLHAYSPLIGFYFKRDIENYLDNRDILQ